MNNDRMDSDRLKNPFAQYSRGYSRGNSEWVRVDGLLLLPELRKVHKTAYPQAQIGIKPTASCHEN